MWGSVAFVRIFSIALLLATTACSPLINSVARKHASHRGIFVQSGSHALGFTYLRTEGYVPGNSKPETKDPIMRTRCSDDLKVIIGRPQNAPHDIDLRKVCGWVLNSVPRKVLDQRTRYEIYLIPSGHVHYTRKSSLSPLTPLTLILVVPWYPDEEQTMANLVDLFAHEAFHLYWFVEDPSAQQSEITAYWIGLCAQLRNGVRLSESNLPGGKLTDVGETGESSSTAAVKVREEAAALMRQGELSTTSPLGADVIARCERAWSPAHDRPQQQAVHSVDAHQHDIIT